MAYALEIDGASYWLDKTCFACPEQYDVYLEKEVVGYLRLRHGCFTARYPAVDGETVFTVAARGDGVFDDRERQAYLNIAVSHIHLARVLD
jgi:hypothetical protein